MFYAYLYLKQLVFVLFLINSYSLYMNIVVCKENTNRQYPLLHCPFKKC